MMNVLFTFEIDVFNITVEQDIGVYGSIPLGEMKGVTGVEHVDSTLDQRDNLQRIAASLQIRTLENTLQHDFTKTFYL